MSEAGPLFRPGSVSWDVLRRPIFLLGGMNALLLQLAEPKVARGVAEHSDFTNRIFDRLRHTVELMVEIGIGDPGDARRAVAAMDRAHDGVQGQMPDGSSYDASDPELRLWVLATLIATLLAVEEAYVGEFDEDDRRRYYQESLEGARVLGVDNAPADLDGFRSYMETRISRLEVTDEAREIAHHVLHPGAPWIPGFVSAPLRLVTAGLLPDPLREAHGLSLSPAHRQWLLRFQRMTRWIVPRLPDWLRTFPVLRPVGGVWDRVTGSVDTSLSYRSR